MELIRSLLGLLLKIALALIFFSIVWWLITLFMPSLSLRSIFSSSATSTDGGWLPAPGSFAGLLGQRNNTGQNGKVFISGPAYNGYGDSYNNNAGYSQVNYITYTADGTEITGGGGSANAKPVVKETTPYAQKELYIRNLSIYEGGHVYTGLSFVGEARNTMFQNGKFAIIIADPMGRVISTSYAEAMTSWSVPGWVRFQAIINSVLPYKIHCTMVFQSGGNPQYSGSYTYSNQQINPIRVAIPVLCN